MRLRGAVAVGGAVGSVARVAVDVAGGDLATAVGWPATVGVLGPTLLVNVAGAFALALLAHRLDGEIVRAALLTGALGAWTTVSTFTVEAASDITLGRPLLATTYVVTTLTAGVLAAWLGQRCAFGFAHDRGPRRDLAREGVVPGTTSAPDDPEHES